MKQFVRFVRSGGLILWRAMAFGYNVIYAMITYAMGVTKWKS